jgi:hypothetical protein
MTKFVGQLASKAERRGGNWYFSIWNTKANEGINSISSTRFEVENRGVPLDLNPLDEIEVTGEVRMPGTCSFEYVEVLNKAELVHRFIKMFTECL